MKTCKTCGVSKDDSEFIRLKTGYLHSYCRPCDRIRQREAYAKRKGALGIPVTSVLVKGKRISAVAKHRKVRNLGDDLVDMLDAPTHEDQRDAAAIVAWL